MMMSNHVHLLVQDTGNDAIPRSMQLMAGRVGQAYHQRKQRNGAFWKDRYHATAFDADTHLVRCVTNIDMPEFYLVFAKYGSPYLQSSLVNPWFVVCAASGCRVSCPVSQQQRIIARLGQIGCLFFLYSAPTN